MENNIPNDTNEKIIEYCYKIIEQMDIQEMELRGIKPNTFLNIFYERARINYLQSGKYELSKEDIIGIGQTASVNARLFRGIINNEVELLGVDENDDLIIEIIKKIEN